MPADAEVTTPTTTAPTSAMLTRAALIASAVAALIKLIPPSYAVDAAAVMGVCAAVAAAWRPTSPTMQGVWAVINGVGMNFGYAKNASAATPPAP